MTGANLITLRLTDVSGAARSAVYVGSKLATKLKARVALRPHDRRDRERQLPARGLPGPSRRRRPGHRRAALTDGPPLVVLVDFVLAEDSFRQHGRRRASGASVADQDLPLVTPARLGVLSQHVGARSAQEVSEIVFSTRIRDDANRSRGVDRRHRICLLF